MQQIPLFVERFDTHKHLIIIIGLFFLIGGLWYGAQNLQTLAILGAFGALAFVLVFYKSLRQTVQYFPDRLIVTGDQTKEVDYRHIKRVWRGSYRYGRHALSAERFPGSKIKLPWYSAGSEAWAIEGTLPAEMLVHNPWTSNVGLGYLFQHPLIIELHNLEKVLILPTHDEARVRAILKTHAPHIEWSPLLA